VEETLGKHYWATEFPYPLGPSDSNAEVFKEELLEGSTLLLGCTRKLMPLSDVYLDIDPWYAGPKVRVGNWVDNTQFYTNIIGDGVFNLTQDLCDGVLDMASRCSNNFVVRSFNYKLETMKVASYFPKPKDFDIPPSKTISFEKYSFYIWKF